MPPPLQKISGYATAHDLTIHIYGTVTCEPTRESTADVCKMQHLQLVKGDGSLLSVTYVVSDAHAI